MPKNARKKPGVQRSGSKGQTPEACSNPIATGIKESGAERPAEISKKDSPETVPIEDDHHFGDELEGELIDEYIEEDVEVAKVRDEFSENVLGDEVPKIEPPKDAAGEIEAAENIRLEDGKMTGQNSHGECGEEEPSISQTKVEEFSENRPVDVLTDEKSAEVPTEKESAEVPTEKAPAEVSTEKDPADLTAEKDPVDSTTEKESAETEDDDDFGSFDEASIESLKISYASDSRIDQDLFPDSPEWDSQLSVVIDKLLPLSPTPPPVDQSPLLDDHASKSFHKLSEAPRLHPMSWVKSKLRSSLLQNLGLPPDLEELDSAPMASYRLSNTSSRPKSTTEHDIDWSTIELPAPDSLSISAEQKVEFINNSASVLAALEEESVNNFSAQTLAECSTEILDQRLKSLADYHSRLLQICAIGKENIEELRQSQAVFESVVENLVGYNQKVHRNELLERLGRSRYKKKGKKTF